MRTFGIVTAVIVGIVLLSVFGFMGTTCNNAQNQIQDHVVNNSFDSYQEFQDMYNTCKQINTDLCSMRSVDEKDKMFDQFSKQQRIVGLKSKLNRWVEEYNAKSKEWNKSMWKSKTLPYQLTTDQFDCYNDSK